MGSLLIGIDFGTAITRAVRWHDQPEWTESVVALPSLALAQDDALRVGRDAAALAAEQPARVICGVKRLLERTADDEIAQALVARAGATLYTAGARLHVRTSAGAALPVDGAVAALLHQAASLVAEDTAGAERYAVITTPEWYGSIEQGSLRAAAERAGVRVLRLIGEGAALALWMAREDDTERTIAIVNAGAGGVSVTLATIDPQGVYIAATADDPRRGGDDVTAALVDGVMTEVEQPEPSSRELVRQAVEQLRPELVAEPSVERTIVLPGPRPAELVIHLDRTDLLPALNSLGDALSEACDMALDDADLELDEVDQVFATGGMSAYPQVVERIASAMGQEVRCDDGMDQQVTLGAAFEAAIVTQQTEGPLVLDGMSTGGMALGPLDG
ncbi:MAG: Hsp70 family protein [Deltaproteobacteria bacterium]|jgi:molecular chaperone DnaK (HSP70)|nr:Hsp70 family protein [Deltaproteobacteria bacterium]MBW2533746.1 Hsp70 family protein [Deltaproteobacteria bacterium]